MNGSATLDFSTDGMHLVGEVDFANVVELAHKGDSWLRERAPDRCRLELGGVTRCNSAGTALLLAWMRTASSAGKQLSVDNPPASLTALMQLSGLQHLLKDQGPTD